MKKISLKSLSRKTAKDIPLTNLKANHMERPMVSLMINAKADPMTNAKEDPKAKTTNPFPWIISHSLEVADLSRESNSQMKRNLVEWQDGRLRKKPSLPKLIKPEVALKVAKRKASKEARKKALKVGQKVVKTASREVKVEMEDLRVALSVLQVNPAKVVTRTRDKRDESEASHQLNYWISKKVSISI